MINISKSNKWINNNNRVNNKFIIKYQGSWNDHRWCCLERYCPQALFLQNEVLSFFINLEPRAKTSAKTNTISQVFAIESHVRCRTPNTQPSDNRKVSATCTWKLPKEHTSPTNCGKKSNSIRTTRRPSSKSTSNFSIGHLSSSTSASNVSPSWGKCWSRWENLNYRANSKSCQSRKKPRSETGSDKPRPWSPPTSNKRSNKNSWKDWKPESIRTFTTTIPRFSINWSEGSRRLKRPGRISMRRNNRRIWSLRNSSLWRSLMRRKVLRRKTSMRKSFEYIRWCEWIMAKR